MQSGVIKKLEEVKEKDPAAGNDYKRPSENVRRRLKSEHLSFLQRQELETTA